MKKLSILIGLLLLTGCAQDMGYYAALPPKTTCKVIAIGPNRYNIEDSLFQKLSGWAEQELSNMGYTVITTLTNDTPYICGEAEINYSTQFIPAPQDNIASPKEGKICTTNSTSLYRYQLGLDIQDPYTHEKFFSISTEMESMEPNTDQILSSMKNVLHEKFLLVHGPESQVETKVTNNILPV